MSCKYASASTSSYANVAWQCNMQVLLEVCICKVLRMPGVDLILKCRLSKEQLGHNNIYQKHENFQPTPNKRLIRNVSVTLPNMRWVFRQHQLRLWPKYVLSLVGDSRCVVINCNAQILPRMTQVCQHWCLQSVPGIACIEVLSRVIWQLTTLSCRLFWSKPITHGKLASIESACKTCGLTLQQIQHSLQNSQGIALLM